MSKSTGRGRPKFKDSRHALGAASEEIVTRHFQSQGFVLKAARWRTPFGEIDLLLFHQTQGWWLVEVKSTNGFEGQDLLSLRQQRRLQRAAEYVAGKIGKMPYCVLAAVNQHGKIEVIPIV